MNKPKKPQVPAPPPPMPPAAGGSTGHWLTPAAAEWRPIPLMKPAARKTEGEQRLEQLLGIGGLRNRDETPVDHIDEWGQSWRSGYHEHTRRG